MQGRKRALLWAASTLVLVGAGGSALAQAAPSDTPTTNEVVVTGLRGSLKDALEQKRSAELVVETISSATIGQLPDVTIAEELNRLPSVSATRDRGNDSQAAIRGLGPRLVLGLVNGREVASSEPDRNVRWEIYPAEAVSGVELYKTQSANLIAGGVAGTVNIKTIAPLDYSGPWFVGRAGAVYNDAGGDIPNYSPWGYRTSLAVVRKLNDDLAVTLGASFQRQKNAFPSFQGWGYNDAATGGSPGYVGSTIADTPWGAQTEVKKLKEDRSSVNGAIQWRPNENFELKFDALYSDVKIDEDQDQQWYSRSGTWGNWGGTLAGSAYNQPGASYVIQNGDVVAATLPWSSVTNTIAHYTEDKTLLVTGLNAVWHSGPWKVTGDASFSEARRRNTWQAIFTEVYPSSTSFDTRAGQTPSVTTSTDPSDPSIQALPNYYWGESDGPEHIKDRLAAGQVDVARELQGSFLTAFEFGARVSDRVKDHNHDRWYEGPITAALPANLLSEYRVHGFNVPPILTGDFNQLAQIAYGGFTEPAGANLLNETWKVHEVDVEGYGRVKFSGQAGETPFHGDFGVRIVHVNTTSDGYESINGGALTPVTLKHDYTEVLPSLNVNFDLAEDRILRFAVSRAIARPPLDELRAGRSLSNTTPPPTGSAGNPLLSPYLATQVDLSYEWYFHPEALFAISPFFKHVDSNIGYLTQPVTIDGVTYNVTGPFNGKGGDIEGFDVTLQTPFYFVPNFESFGVYANYAFVNSSIKEFSPANNPLPAAGLAKHTAQVDLWYSHAGFETRLGYKHTSPMTVIYGWNSQQLTRLESQDTLDFSASYQFTKEVSARFQVSNLTDEPARFYWDNRPDRLARYDLYGRRYELDLIMKVW